MINPAAAASTTSSMCFQFSGLVTPFALGSRLCWQQLESERRGVRQRFEVNFKNLDRLSVGEMLMKIREVHKAHVVRLHSRVARASSAGMLKLARQHGRRCLAAYDAKLLAVRNSFRTSGRPRVPAEMTAIAQKICPWKGSTEPVMVFSVAKGSSGHRRIVMKFGIENRTLQHLVKPVLKETAKLHPHQYGLKGVPLAIARVASKMAEGYVFARELDIQDCFPSFVEEKLSQFLLLPKEVIRNVIVSAHLNLVSGNLHELFGLAEDGVESPLTTDTFVQARRGIPQGSAASNIVSEIVLSHLYHALPKSAVVTGYADNTLLMGKTEKEVVSITKAFGCSLKEHPVGLLAPKLKGSFTKDQSIDYLGHQLTMQAGKVVITPHPDNLTDFGRGVQWRLARVKKAPSPFHRGRAERAYRAYVYSWTANYCLCDGIDVIRKHTMAKLEGLKN